MDSELINRESLNFHRCPYTHCPLTCHNRLLQARSLHTCYAGVTHETVYLSLKTIVWEIWLSTPALPYPPWFWYPAGGLGLGALFMETTYLISLFNLAFWFHAYFLSYTGFRLVLDSNLLVCYTAVWCIRLRRSALSNVTLLPSSTQPLYWLNLLFNALGISIRYTATTHIE